MKKFEVGKEYFTHSICDSDCMYTIKIAGRTEKTVTYIYGGKKRRSKIQVSADGEFIQPDRYSMAPVFRAEREVQPEASAEPKESEKPIIIMIGQRLELVCGAYFPVQGGTVIGFEDIPATRFSRGGVHAVVKWDGTDEFPAHIEKVCLIDIHPRGWRSANGSPLGVFVSQ
ncbi:hypothetical protein [Caproiciproducens sp. CPB-2]|uniref:hypothetical protein n=1 Tax=Caproiciproducens sp. CPB-2 TaxID=3030017 RepID=UPI0023DA7A54|nr:hypothetical protein [Caproiciproducens sp. CPB-2]MDF1495473.1 hypothetical protein [Caproiciproducens sp. CPB-2]